MTTAGLILSLMGIFTLLLGKLIVPFLIKGNKQRNPDENHEKYSRFQKVYALFFGGLALVTGLVLLVVGLLSGGRIGFDS